MLICGNYEKQCSYTNWYPVFKDISLDSILVPISDDVCDYLLEDSTMVLPQEVYTNVKTSSGEQEEDSWDEEDPDGSDDDDESEIKQPSFPAFSDALREAISTLGGEVFIKLNWSAPVDAAWITSSKSLKCSSIEDVYLLLKSSDILAKELAYIKAQVSSGVEGCVVVKKWHDVYPGHEFRCFVIRNKLVGISQRDYKTYYGYLPQNKFVIIEDLERFFKERLRGRSLPENYIFDVWRQSSNRIRLIDIGPFDTKTNSMLFSWTELHEMENMNDDQILSPEFRFLGDDPGFQPNPYQHYGLPRDLEMLSLSSSVIDQIREEVNSQESEEHSTNNEPLEPKPNPSTSGDS